LRQRCTIQVEKYLIALTIFCLSCQSFLSIELGRKVQA
jgi:hypothetical protein